MTTTSEKFSRPGTEEYAEYYDQYISKFHVEDFLVGFAAQVHELRDLLGGLTAEQVSQPHAPYTWTLKQVVGHLIDCERIFSTRALRIAANDETPIPGIDQNIYVKNFDYQSTTMSELLDEFSHLRNANVMLSKRLTAEALERRGVASGNPVSAKANLFILAGHLVYHVEIMKKRLGV